MRIAIFSDTFPPEVNGVANFVRTSAKSLAGRGHVVKVFTLSKLPKRELRKINAKHNIKVYTLPSVPAIIYPTTRLSLPSGLALPKIISFKPDIIHLHTPFTTGWEAIAGAKILKIPLIGTHHTFYDQYLKHLKIDSKITRKYSWKYTIFCYNFCNFVTVPSRALAEEMKNYKLKKSIKILPYFIDTDLFKPSETEIKNPFQLVHVGRLSYEKSIDQVINAFSIISKNYPQGKLIIVGDGPERKKLEKLAIKLGLKEKINFTGFLKGKKLLKVLRESTIFVSASKTETFCIAILEAMAVGLPIVTVKKNGPTEFVRDEQNGYLVEPDNYKEIAQKIIFLLENKKVLKGFEKKSRELAEQYSIEKNVINLENLYKKLIRSRN